MNLINDHTLPNESATQTLEVKPDRSIRNIALAVLVLWAVLSVPAMFVLSASPVAMRLWLAFLASNLLVWPSVLIAGVVLEGIKSIKSSPMLQSFEKPEMDALVVPEGRLAMD